MPRKVRVLLADDEKHVRTYIKAVLVGLGCEVVGEAENGSEAVSLYQETSPDVVLMDVNMPGKDGLAALRDIKKNNPNAAVIMLTSLSDMATVHSAAELGALQYIRKDTPVAELKQIIVEAWKEHLNDATE
ncbi:response regulator transcription factor [Saezia sanguinis]|uniref:response regulator transcription factor n=1 Tax=Saezia sanguinis TaxID=1965230 RepID=UPI0030490612